MSSAETTQQPSLSVRVKFLDGPDGPYHQSLENGDPKGGFDYATPDSAGIDLRACMQDNVVVIGPGERAKIPTGVAIEPMRRDVAGFVFSRSGLGAVQGLTVAQGVGVIDPDYRGEIIVFLLNTSQEIKTVKRGDRIAQLLFLPFFRAVVEPVQELGETDRGSGGFGHTGKQ